MYDANLRVLQDVVHFQQLEIKRLARLVSSLCDQGFVLRQILDELGIMRVETFCARLHRHRFEETRHASNFDATFDDLVSLPGCIATIGKVLAGSDFFCFEHGLKKYIKEGSVTSKTLRCGWLLRPSWAAVPQLHGVL